MILDNGYTFIKVLLYVTRFAKTQHNAQHNGTFLKIQVFASLSSVYLKLYSVVLSMLYYKYILSYKAR